MVINENNSHINSFTKGMNSDQAFDQIQNSQYTFAKNIRITKNQLLGGASDYSSVREGIVAPVPDGIHSKTIVDFTDTVLSVKSVDNLCVIVSKNDAGDLNVYRCYINEISGKTNNFELLWKSPEFWNGSVAPSQVSTVLYKELENVIKLYIATGKVPVIVLRVDEEGESTLRKQQNDGTWMYTDVDYLINNRIIPRKRVFISNKISGRLKTSQVQYTYRYYNKYANTTQLAPLTNKIQIIDPSRSKEVGNAEDTETSVGLTITINTKDYSGVYERLQVYRLSYIVPGQDAEVALIYDGKFNDNFILNDVGIDPLQILTIEEFAAMSGVMLIPQVIEQNQEYMFCSNVSDDTIIKDLEITVDANPYDLVESKVVLATNLTGSIPDEGNYTFGQIGVNLDDYFKQRSINVDLAKPSYDNIFTSSLLRSLRRGEQYRYGIVYYDKYGRRSDVKTICDVNVHSISSQEMPFDTEIINGQEILIAYPKGVKIKIPQITGTGVNPEDIIGCQIVRRSSSEIYQNTLMQVALARPLQQGLSELHNELTPNKQSPFYPSGFLSVNDMTILPSYYTNDVGGNWRYEGENAVPLGASTKNNSLFQIFSSEIDFRRDDVLSKLNVSDTLIQEQFYIPSTYSVYKNGVLNETNSFEGIVSSSTNSPTDINTTWNEYESNDDYSYVVNADQFDLNANNIWLQPSQKESQSHHWTFSFYINDTPLFQINEGENIIPIIRALPDPSVFSGNLRIQTNHRTLFTISSGFGMSVPGIVNLEIATQFVQYSQTSSTAIGIDRAYVKKLTSEDKKDFYYIFNYFKTGIPYNSNFNTSALDGKIKIQKIKDVKIPNWNDGFDRVDFDDDGDVLRANKEYTGFNTTIDKYSYNNWVSFGKYDLNAGNEYSPNQSWDAPETKELIGHKDRYWDWLHASRVSGEGFLRNGYIGPGPSCFLLVTERETGGFPTQDLNFYTSVCNIQHVSKQDNVESDEQVQFFGFGNYFELEYKNQRLQLLGGGNEMTVFDGDIYITPHEFTTIYKAYNFESVDTLQSMQITNYIPLESKVNTYFDYGMNLRNTVSANLMYEPGSIDGVTTQERPAHQYNMIYSDNDASNDVFTLISTDKNETNMFKQRAYFSELKNNGEFIDNFLIFKALSFIDVDSKYGQITNLCTDKNLLYYWQEHAFGKFSVNERSLINDQNGNTIMLGQAGILSRYDYLSTKYGMRLYDFCARPTENGVYWADMNNKAIIAASGNQVVNYGEQIGIQNIINDRIDIDRIPNIDYDIQNNELLCQILKEGEQLVLNTKYNIPVSIYNRKYDEVAYIKNHLFGLFKDTDNNQLVITKHNYLDNYSEVKYLAPMILDFVVNPNVSVVKVFDNQQIVPIKRSGSIIPNVSISVETDLYKKTDVNINNISTDREGNLLYAIPRFDNEPFGNRMRGKWMKVRIENEEPTDYSTLSHVITKFRQSYS